MRSNPHPLFEPYHLTMLSPVFTLLRFAPSLASIPQPAKRARARLYCHHCHCYHHLAWEEMHQAITGHQARTLNDIVATYAWKYCRYPTMVR